MKYELREYQKDIVNLVNSKDKLKAIVCMATGLGKTVTMSQFERKGRMLILSHRDELVRQPKKYFDGVSFGVEKAQEYATDEEVVSASVQSFYKNNRLKRYSPDAFETIIVDEAHHCMTQNSTYMNIINYFSPGCKKLIGLTATPKRGDGVRLDNVFDEILCNYDLKYGIKNHYLCNLRCTRVTTEYSLSKIKKVAGDFNQKEIGEVMGNNMVVATAVKTYIEECHKKKKHSLIYCVTKQNCKLIANAIKNMLPKDERKNISVITGDTDQEERNRILTDFQNPNDDSAKAIINCMVLTEGTDIPCADAILNLRPTSSSSLYTQMVGRGTRLYENPVTKKKKEFCLVIDFVPSEGESRNLCTAPTLFGINPQKLTASEKQNLNEEVDLLEYCEELAGKITDIAKVLNIKLCQYDSFVSETKKLISDYTVRNTVNCDALVNDIESREDCEDENTIDFGDLIVQECLDDERHYKIIPNYNDIIYVSKPDILGKVRVTYEIHSNTADIVSELQKKYPKETKNVGSELLIVGEDNIKDALIAINHICELQPDYMRAASSKSVRSEWKDMSATEKQTSALYNKLNNLESLDNIYLEKDISKYSASYMIDLCNRVIDCHKFIKRYNTEDLKTKKAKQKRFDDYEQVIEHQNEKSKINNKMYQDLKQILDVKSAEKQKKDAEKAAEEAKNADVRLDKITVAYEFYGNGNTYLESPPTEKMTNYYDILLHKAKNERNIKFVNRKVDYDKKWLNTKNYVGFMIGLLKKLTSESKYKDLEIDLTDIYNALETIYKEKKSMNFDIRLHQI